MMKVVDTTVPKGRPARPLQYRGLTWRARRVIFEPSYPEPWDLAEWDSTTGDIVLASGDIEIHNGTDTDYITPSPLTVTIDTTGTDYVWVDLDLSGAAAATIETGASKPNSGDTNYRKLLWEFEDGAPVKRWHRGNVEFVGWRP